MGVGMGGNGNRLEARRRQGRALGAGAVLGWRKNFWRNYGGSYKCTPR